MNRWHLPCARLFAAGLIAAALAAPLSASAGVDSVQSNSASGFNLIEVSTPPTVRVTSREELVNTLGSNFTGRVIIPADVEWDLSGFRYIPLKSGVSLIGERGLLGSRPRLYTRVRAINNAGYDFFKVVGCDVRVEGIHFQGPANTDEYRSSSQPMVSGIYVFQQAFEPTAGGERSGEVSGLRVVIADCEFDEWTKSGVQVEATTTSQIRPDHAGLVRVERNYIHHNARDDGGHGVGVSYGSYVTIESNVFDYNRHAVEAEWQAGGYVAHFNYVLQGGYTQDGSVGSYYNQHFDAHGQYGGYGGRAGEYFEIAYNTIRGEQSYYHGLATRPALMLRGTPDIGLRFNSNIVVHDNHDEAVSFKSGLAPGTNRSLTLQDLIRDGKYDAGGNHYDTDYSMELATGDFDGDGLSDVFVANGTAWFFSRGGQRPWEFLHISDKRTRDLGFADIDNDRITDVLYRDPNGNLGVLKSGRQGLANFTTVPKSVTIQDLRFGDFDGDGKTDIFYTLGYRWWIWYGKSHTWTATQSASAPVSEMLFGEFDGVRGTDLMIAVGKDWLMSSGAAAGWTRLEAWLPNSLANAVAADFDGNGKTDIAFNDGDRWLFSRDAHSPLTVLRSGDATTGYPRLKAQLIGQFEYDAGVEVVSFEYKKFPFVSLYLPGERLVFWRGLATGGGIGFASQAYDTLSEQNMR